MRAAVRDLEECARLVVGGTGAVEGSIDALVQRKQRLLATHSLSEETLVCASALASCFSRLFADAEWTALCAAEDPTLVPPPLKLAGVDMHGLRAYMLYACCDALDASAHPLSARRRRPAMPAAAVYNALLSSSQSSLFDVLFSNNVDEMESRGPGGKHHSRQYIVAMTLPFVYLL